MQAHFLQLAIDLATANVAEGGGPFGAVIVKNGIVIATGVNRVTKQLDPTAHAEIQAIRAACLSLNDFQLTDCQLYSSCEPCPMCLGAIYWARLDAVYFAANRFDAAQAGFDDEFIYQDMSLSLEKRQLITQQLLLTHAKQPFETWTNAVNKTRY